MQEDPTSNSAVCATGLALRGDSLEVGNDGGRRCLGAGSMPQAVH